jgi:hypothetical protein
VRSTMRASLAASAASPGCPGWHGGGEGSSRIFADRRSACHGAQYQSRTASSLLRFFAIEKCRASQAPDNRLRRGRGVGCKLRRRRDCERGDTPCKPAESAQCPCEPFRGRRPEPSSADPKHTDGLSRSKLLPNWPRILSIQVGIRHALSRTPRSPAPVNQAGALRIHANKRCSNIEIDV